jgi:hypothetical protein
MRLRTQEHGTPTCTNTPHASSGMGHGPPYLLADNETRSFIFLNSNTSYTLLLPAAAACCLPAAAAKL